VAFQLDSHDYVIVDWTKLVKSLKLLPSDAFPRLKIRQKCVCGRALPRTPLEELTALPRPPSWIYGGLLRREGEKGGREEWEGRGKEGAGEGKERKAGRGGKGRGGREV